MKAKTKSAKRRLKTGRPRIEGMERTPSGQISRSKVNLGEREKDVMATVIDARARLHGANEANAKSPEWGYVLGRIYMDGNLGRGHLANMRLKAGNNYATDIGRYYGLTGIPFPSARAQCMFSIGGFDGDVSESRADAARKASAKMMALEGVLLRCEDGRSVATTVKNICILDLDEARGWPTHMHGLLRRGLDALILHYQLTG
jgi:hypothetical protein